MKVQKLGLIKGFLFLLFCVGSHSLHAEGISCEDLTGQIAFGTSNHYFFEDSSYYKKFGSDAFIRKTRLLKMINDIALRAADLWVNTQNQEAESRLTKDEEKKARKVFESFSKLFETEVPDCSGLLELQKIQETASKRFVKYMSEYLKGSKKKMDLNLPYYYSTLFSKESAVSESALKKDLWVYFVTFLSEKDAHSEMLLQPVHYTQKQRKLGGDPYFFAELAETYFLALDPHSQHFTPSKHRAFNAMISNNAAGIGVYSSTHGDDFLVKKIYKGGAADIAKQEALKNGGDYLEVDDVVTEVSQDGNQYTKLNSLTSRDAMNLLLGDEGQSIYLRAKRKELPRVLEVKLVRKKMNTNLANPFYYDVVDQLGPDNKVHKVGIIRFLTFYTGVANDVKEALAHLKARGIESLIIDLRSNGGGSMADAVMMVDLFISSAVVVQKKNGFGDIEEIPPRSYMDKGIEYTGPLVIAVDKASASASEVFSGALKVYKRAVIVGNDTTFCKGTVQKLFDTSDKPNGGALKITIEGYFLPNGVSPQNDGVQSDVVLPHVRNDLFSQIADKGERSFGNAIKFKNIDPFMTTNFAHGSGETWKDVDDSIVKSLNERSLLRLKNDPIASKITEYNSRVESILEKGNLTIAEKLSLDDFYYKHLQFKPEHSDQENDETAQLELLKYRPNIRMDDREILSVSTDLLSLISK